MTQVQFIQSRTNPLFKELRLLAQDNTAYRSQGRIWVEGDHLIGALASSRLQLLVLSESASAACPRPPAERTVVLSDALWESLSALASPAGIGGVWTLPPAPTVQPLRPTVILDRLQDAGNVGSILRSAAAFGFEQVLAVSGTAALWSPKVLRAAMGAHFSLCLIEGQEAQHVRAQLQLPLMITSSHQGQALHEQVLPWPCAWVFGHEGQGVDPIWQGGEHRALRIAQPAGQESLNVAAAAAVCLHASAVQHMAGSGAPATH